MSVIALLVLIAVAAVVLWGVGQFPVLDPTLKKIITIVIYVVVDIYVILWVAALFGYAPPSLHLR